MGAAGSFPFPTVVYQYQKSAMPLEPVESLRINVQPLGTEVTVAEVLSSANSPMQTSSGKTLDNGKFRVTLRGFGVGLGVGTAVGEGVGPGVGVGGRCSFPPTQ